MNTNGLNAAEAILFEELTVRHEQGPAPIFILHSPRTGSTYLYQIMVAALSLPYFSNFVNDHFGEQPLLGLVLQNGLALEDPIKFTSRFGKSDGAWQPAEASYVMRNWFGGGHPSETVSADFLDGKEDHCRRTLEAIRYLSNKPLVNKNAWNSFRIQALFRACPDASFIWMRRDVLAASKSDLIARYMVQNGDPEIWNSASPSNMEELKKRPYWEQVVENQFEFARAISGAFAELPEDQKAEIWYEDFVTDTQRSLNTLRSKLTCLHGCNLKLPDSEYRHQKADASLSENDYKALSDYIEENFDRLAHLIREDGAPHV